MTSEMKIKAIAPWLGSKRTMAVDIIEELGTHRAYFGLCFGSLSVELRKPVSGQETVCELHDDVTNLAMVLASDQCPLLYDKLSSTLMAEPLFEACTSVCRSSFSPPNSPAMVAAKHVDRAWAYFVWSWQGRNGTSGTRRKSAGMAVRYTPGGGAGGLRFANAVDSIPSWHQRLRQMVILHRDIFEVIPKIEDVEGVAIYADPPYIIEGKQYVHPFSAEDHNRLSSDLSRFKKARIVLSYYDHPLLEKLYPSPQWICRKMTRNKHLHQQNRRGQTGSRDAPEVLIINGPSYVKEARAGQKGLFE